MTNRPFQKWKAVYPERVLVHAEYNEGPPEQPFMLALHSTWQRIQMCDLVCDLSHGSALAMDLTFATN